MADFIVPCVVSGEIIPNVSGGTPHATPLVPGNDADHSHYVFISTLIACTDIPTGIGMFADGGNDGHLTPNEGVVQRHETATPAGDHHGATDESGWSHCSGYSRDSDNSCNDSTDEVVTDAESNVCVATGFDKSKGDVEFAQDVHGGFGDRGWMKYIRIGVVMYVWGCFDTPVEPRVTANPYFSGVLAVFSPAVLAGGVVGNPAFPLCIVPRIPFVNPNPPRPHSCGFSVMGHIWRGDRWLVDFAAVDGVADFGRCVGAAGVPGFISNCQIPPIVR